MGPVGGSLLTENQSGGLRHVTFAGDRGMCFLEGL